MTCTSPGQRAGISSGGGSSEEIRLPPQPPAGDMLRVAVQPRPEGTCILQVIGEIDLVTAPLLRSSAMEALERPHRRLVLDLQQVAFLASSGLAVLVDIRTEALRRGVGLQLVTTSRAVLRPLIATGLIQLFEVDASGTEPI